MTIKKSRFALRAASFMAGALLCLGFAAQGCGSDDSTFFPDDDGGDGGNIGDGGQFGDGGQGDGGCVNLECKQVKCTNGATTSLSGTVFDPAGKVPLYNVVVYVPNAPVDPIPSGATCDRCGSVLSGSPVVATLTDAHGNFKLENVPVTDNLPLVIQVGKWRRQITIPTVPECVDTPLTDKNLTRLPKNSQEGHIPLTAISTGGADRLECLLLKMGVDQSEFSTNAGTGRIHFYTGTDGSDGFAPGVNGGDDFPSSTPFWASDANLKKYDMVILSCEGDRHAQTKPQAALDALQSYLGAGGRVFASHWHEYWFSNGPQPFPQLGAWVQKADTQDPATAIVNDSFPKGAALKEWLSFTGVSQVPGSIQINEGRHNLDSVNLATSQDWLSLTNANENNETAVEYMSFNTPVNVAEDKQCGRAVYSDLHVSADSKEGERWPLGCAKNMSGQIADLTDQEKVLEFMLFDLASCVQSDKQPPKPPVIK